MNDATHTEVATPHSVAVLSKRTKNGNPVKCQHFNYRMDCADYDALEQRSGGRCEICGVVPKRPNIDHDYNVGFHGVRGLVCPKCNAHMRHVDTGRRPIDDATAAYLSRPFWRERGLKPAQRDTPNWESWRQVSATVQLFAERNAERHGKPLSEFLSEALTEYVAKHRKEIQ